MTDGLIKNYEGDINRVLEEVAAKYGWEFENIKPVAGYFANLVYEIEKNNRVYILRLTHLSHRSPQQIEAELLWIRYLAEHDVPVIRSVSSTAGNLFEKIESEGELFTAAVFDKARGVIAGELEDGWDKTLFQEWGRVTGRMHALAKSYSPGDGSARRYDWFDDAYLQSDRYVPDNQPRVLEKFHLLIDNLHGLPIDNESYGLIHADFHKRNFFVDAGRITLFDFDDCQYCWFISDIAISLFSVIAREKRESARPDVAREFLKYFLEGYSRENKIDPAWLGNLPLFLKLREMINYIDGCTHWDFNRLSPGQRRFVDKYRFNIENDVPLVDMDFTNL
ncbi:MAG: phosphotransferase [candidate division Zixibacteria bacterium]|nr:phosphotransferase [candidate division Zixibacteria bacterium]